MNGQPWTVAGVWNSSLIAGKDRPAQARNHMWASELGGAYIDRYLRMTGVEQSNKPNERSRRKFQAGHIWEAYVVSLFQAAGILTNAQEHLSFQYPELLEVTGRLDLLAGGTPDWEKAQATVKEHIFFEPMQEFALNMIKQMRTSMPADMRQVVIEVKSCATSMFDRYERTGKGNPHHELQLFHYLKAKGLPEGHLFYVCKDDCRLLEFVIFNAENCPQEQLYKADIEKMTQFIKNKEQPPLELEVAFSPDLGKFQKNWKVEYSGYLTMLYGYKTPEAYRERWDREVSSFNRTLGRIVKGDKMTKLNLEVIEKMQAYFPELDSFIEIAKDLAKKGELDVESEVAE